MTTEAQKAPRVRRPATDPGRAARGMAATAVIVAVIAIVYFSRDGYPGLLTDCDFTDTPTSPGPARDAAIEEWRDRWRIINAIALVPLGAALSVWLRAVWGDRNTTRALVAMLVAPVVLIAVPVQSLGVVGGALGIAALPAYLLWMGASLFLGVIFAAVVGAIAACVVASRKPASRWVHWIMLVLVVSAWIATAFGAMGIAPDGSLC